MTSIPVVNRRIRLLFITAVLVAASFIPATHAVMAESPGTIWSPGEYETLDGVLVAWEGYTALLEDFVVEASESDTSATVYIIVDSTSERSTVTNTLTGAGADMNNVQFLVSSTDSIWLRDYGPRYVFQNGEPVIIDHDYNRPRSNDNAFPGWLGDEWGHDVYVIEDEDLFTPTTDPYGNPATPELVHGGGNLHVFSDGDAFASSLILEENPGYSEADIIQMFQDFMNVSLTIYDHLPGDDLDIHSPVDYVDGTGHIDMWFLPIADKTVMVSQFEEGVPGYAETENAVADLIDRGYSVYRVPAWNDGPDGLNGTHYTYTNAAIVNNKVFIPQYGGLYTDADNEALTVYQTAMPSHEVIQIDCASIINNWGAIHCVLKHVYALPFADMPTVVNYDFSDITSPSCSHKAEDGEIDVACSMIRNAGFPARRGAGIGGWQGWDEAETFEYGNLCGSDDSWYQGDDPGNGDNAAMLFEFYVDPEDDTEDLERIDVSLELGRASSLYFGWVYLWDYAEGHYTILGTQGGTTDQLIKVSVFNNPGNYIDPATGQLTVFVVNEDVSDWIQVDNINIRCHWWRDKDGDGYTVRDGDCNDWDDSIYPGAPEVCDGIDNDCDGLVDDDDPDCTGQATWYQDSDNDGYGNPNASLDACTQPAGYVSDDTDCDDSDENVNPGVHEVCDDGIDNDCDGYIDGNDTDCTSGYPPWDVNRDGVIDLFDMVRVSLKLGEPNGTPGWIPEDVNADGVIDLFDLVQISLHLGE